MNAPVPPSLGDCVSMVLRTRGHRDGSPVAAMAFDRTLDVAIALQHGAECGTTFALSCTVQARLSAADHLVQLCERETARGVRVVPQPSRRR